MLLSNLNLLATAPGGVARLRELILTLAVQGKLLPQNPQDEPASVLLKKIRAEKDRLIAEGKIKRDKPLTTIAEDEKPFEVPVGWEWVRFGDLVNASDAGWSPTCIGSPRRSGFWGVLKVSAVSWGAFNASANKELPANLSPRPQYEVKDGDFLLSRANTEELVARSVVVGKAEPMLMLSDKIIRLDVSSLVSRVFLNLCNNASHSRAHYIANASGTSSSMKNVSRDVVLRGAVPLPPLAEQTRIVTRVEELMRLCDALETKGQLAAAQHAQLVSTLLGTLTDSATPDALAENWQRIASHFDLLLDRPQAVDALEQTILQLAVRGLLVPQDPTDEPARILLKKIRTEKDRLIAAGQIKRDKPLPPIADDEQPFAALPQGWAWARVGDVVGMLNGYAFKSEWFKPAGVRLLRNVNIGHGRVDWTQPEFIDATMAAEFEQFALREGDVVLTLDRPIISTGLKLAVLTASDLPCFLLQRVARLAPESKVISQEFLVLWMKSDLFMDTIDPGRSTGVPHISTKQVGNLVAGLPPLAEQSRIVARVESLRRLCADLRQRLSTSQTTQAKLAEALVENAVIDNEEKTRTSLC